MRIVVMEPDVALGFFLRKGLSAEGHTVTWVQCPADAVEAAGEATPDLVVVEASTSEGTDLIVCLHRDHPRTAMLALVRRDTVEDCVRCLDLGADDCMAKPFSFQELTARCRALLRRRANTGEEEVVLKHGVLTLHRIQRSASIADRAISLTAKEFRLLEYLLQNAGRCCSRTELLREVFHLPADNATNVVDVYINYLRRKLVSAGDSVRILTIRGAGYRFAGVQRTELRPIDRAATSLHASA